MHTAALVSNSTAVGEDDLLLGCSGAEETRFSLGEDHLIPAIAALSGVRLKRDTSVWRNWSIWDVKKMDRPSYAWSFSN